MTSERPCPICGGLRGVEAFAESNVQQEKLGDFSYASRKLPEYMHHRLLRCAQCDLLFASPVPDSAHLQAAYEGAAFDSATEAEAAAETYSSLLNGIVRSLPDRYAALDIGTGDGAFLRKLVHWGFDEVLGIEPSWAPIAAASPDVRPLIQQGLFEPGRLPQDHYALVTCFQTIEHVQDPQGLCNEVARVLRPDGVFCVVGHNQHALSARLLGRRSPIFDVEHLQLFSPRSLRAMFDRAGLKVVSLRSFWNRYPIRYWTRLLPFPPRMKHGLLNALGQRWVGRVSVALPAGNLVVFGMKPRA